MTNLVIDVPAYKVTYEKKETAKVLRQAASEVAKGIRRLIRGKGVQPSAPGEPPISKSGKLASSIKVSVTTRNDQVTARIRDVAFYATMLEKGAIGGGGKKGQRNKRGKPSTRRVLQPRPFMYRVLDEKASSLTERMQEAIMNDMAFVKAK
jgi:hypothetical protein